jgi:hypothetical protein
LDYLTRISTLAETSLIQEAISEFISSSDVRIGTDLGDYSAKHSNDEMSETWIGEWAEKQGIRDQLFIATKVRFKFMVNLRT